MNPYVGEMILGIFLAATILLVKVSISFTAPFIYQGF
jgi:hypothetical protein